VTQCMGTTQKGDRCKRNANEESDYCNAHGFQAGREPDWKNPKPKAEPKAKAKSKTREEPQEAWSWSACCDFDNENVKWAAIGVVAFGALFLLRRR